jgi:hypothetical protein
MPKWITKDGQEINISDMTNDHLINSIRFIEKKIEVIQAIFPSTIVYTDPGAIYPIYDDLMAEALIRGLDFTGKFYNVQSDIKKKTKKKTSKKTKKNKIIEFNLQDILNNRQEIVI